MWPFTKKKKLPVAVDTELDVPRIIFEMHDDGNILIAVSWPPLRDIEDKGIFIQNFATLVYLINSGKLLPGLQHAISIFNVDNPQSQEISRAILVALNMISSSGLQTTNRPVVSPSEAFQVRGNQP